MTTEIVWHRPGPSSSTLLAWTHYKTPKGGRNAFLHRGDSGVNVRIVDGGMQAVVHAAVRPDLKTAKAAVERRAARGC